MTVVDWVWTVPVIGALLDALPRTCRVPVGELLLTRPFERFFNVPLQVGIDLGLAQVCE